MIKDSQGNTALLEFPKTTFLCSRRCPAQVVLKSYDWAIEKRNAKTCVLSGNHSQIEKDVLHNLLKGEQSIIVALARGLKKRLESELAEALAKNRLLIITPFPSRVSRITQETANMRNELMAELADEIFVAYAQPAGNIERLVRRWLQKGKKICTFDVQENKMLIERGVWVYEKGAKAFLQTLQREKLENENESWTSPTGG
jgi:predicted Rossmann fold nucleotide-binding protein DprA/Smf involved in DNA uptake